MTFTKEQLTNILTLIRRAPIKGEEAVATALLIQAIQQAIVEADKPAAEATVA